ncbi:hypothetical protein H310_06663 [Aphanomyces invadans]|uniref:Uncharacterized protein n=1 Tax=Aphanomyces invadans TaxID=157072 RepID=A0A024U3P4_9STRA|nr:hypothetical protein H310_06663 [Aphanomyces invadans]ETW01031.1 hypothetical protein H310_06663 [Aphanomyces invadans]|eukprot:XP_008870029.1 hypothetical protein H310_06663 [Aphanomyces invadans]
MSQRDDDRHGGFTPGGPPALNSQPAKRVNAANPFASGPVATVNQVRPGAVFGVPPGTVPFRPSASSQLNTPLGHKQLPDPPPMADTTGVANPPKPAQFHTHEFDTDSLVHAFQTTNLNSTPFGGPTELPAGLSIQHDDPFQRVPSITSSFPISSNIFQAPPPPSAAAVPRDLFTSNFNSGDSVGSDAFPTNDPNTFARAPPLPPARRDSFNSPFETAPSNVHDPFRQLQYQNQPPATPPPPAAPFLNYNSSPHPHIPSTSPNTLFNQPPPSASPKPFATQPQRPPPSPQSQLSRDITMAPRTVDDLFEEFMSHVAPDKLPSPVTNVYDLPPTLDTLVGLYREQQWQQLEAKAWSMLSSPDPEFNLHVHTWAMVALMKLGKIDDLEQQVIVLGDLDHHQYQYESYPEQYGGKRGSFVPLRLRYMAVQLPRLKNNVSMYETMASQLLVDLQQNAFDLTPENATEWQHIVSTNLIHSFLDRKKFDAALRLATALYSAQHLGADARQRVILASRLGRIYLQLGDLTRAEELFADAAAFNLQIDSPRHDCSARLLLNQGLLHFAHNRFKEALDAFNTILGVYSGDDAVDHDSTEPFASWDDGDVVSSAANNMSICALYSCEVQTAVTVLETVLQSDPRRHLHSAIVFNLSTLYDLVCDSANSTNRKGMIKRLADTYNVEHIDTACFRI